jgi:hypothetical protein
MPNSSTDALFQLIKSLEKGEKRNFKLYAKRNSGEENLKTVLLFDALDKMEVYDEALLLQKNRGIKKQQLSNLKANLYKHILSSLRLLRDDDNIDLVLHEYMDHARILYNKGLYLQSLKALDKLKLLARQHFQHTFLLQALIFEKKIEALHITRSMDSRAEVLVEEVEEINERLVMIGKLSNLSLQLYAWYIKMGHARDEKDEIAIRKIFESDLPPGTAQLEGFYEKLYLSQCYCWHAFILQDFLQYYRYTQKWVDVYEASPFMKKVEVMFYIKGMHNLLNAHFLLRNYEKFNKTLQELEKFSRQDYVVYNDNARIQTFIYLHFSKINLHFMEGSFNKGLKLVPIIEENLEKYRLYLDRHRVLVFYYKIACLYFGSGDNEKTIDYLNKIIHWKVDLRTDIQCYSRLLHLIAHYELGNFDLLEYLIKSVYRFMANMKNLSTVEEEVFRFLRKSFHLSQHQLKDAFQRLHDKLVKHEHSRTESRSYMYLDIISWLESKIKNLPVQTVIRDKYMISAKRGR